MHISTYKVRQLRKLSQRTVSLDSKIGEDNGSTYGEMIDDVSASAPSEKVDMGLLRDRMADVLKVLNERERIVVESRYGLYDGVAKTLDEVGLMFNVTRERIRQIEIGALKKLRGCKDVAMLAEFLVK